MQSASYKTLKPKAQLFKLEANLLTNGNVELLYDSVRPEDFERTMNKGMPEYEGSHSVASLLRYLRTVADDGVLAGARRSVARVHAKGSVGVLLRAGYAPTHPTLEQFKKNLAFYRAGPSAPRS